MRELHKNITTELPPVAGVVNAAMVLQDSLFANTTVDMLKRVLSPKVDGSKHLDELFSDPSLDFFILFSSLSVVSGNSGQTSYTAANAYLTGLATQRRRRGLPASVIDLGPVLGLGYITRSGQIAAEDINNFGAYPISEWDLLEHFAEAVLASPISQDGNYEIISGAREVDPIIDDRVSWLHNPRLSHLVIDKEQATISYEERKIPVKQQLLESRSAQQAHKVVLGKFTSLFLATNHS